MNISIMIAKTLVAIVAIQHLFFMWLEMFAWETVGRKFFKGNRQGDFFRQTKSLAANQGLYNGFLAAGLIWSFLISDSVWQINVMTFFLGCVVVAGIFGGYSVSRKIFLVQAIPAMLALIFLHLL
ncbi:MAG TPA: DUF1304 domain-containing protein [Saprospiraceae bacterium]|jgi:putative membrane protein|nr:DUF1304 domain-containing protein [Saprospiraceae bacterium]MCO5283604.1 DUF1304 domain-containing protein [Saprospiraceae bacterium]HRN32790.1 DUF1304 domain-containing protein [Saprospiraceae bacterium]HRP83112.1 DUF1304 domain-containing protein [Saprospiraceae bacterium]